MTKDQRDREKELKYMMYLIDIQINELKKEKKIYVDELNRLGYGKKHISKKSHL